MLVVTENWTGRLLEKCLGTGLNLVVDGDTTAGGIDGARKANGKIRRERSDRKDDAARLSDYILLYSRTRVSLERKEEGRGTLFLMLRNTMR